jgi:hypothetical protein
MTSVRGIISDCRRVRRMIQRYDDRVGNGAGGRLHIYIEDGNIEDSDLAFCEDRALVAGDYTAARLARILRLCSKTQRRKCRYYVVSP